MGGGRGGRGGGGSPGVKGVAGGGGRAGGGGAPGGEGEGAGRVPLPSGLYHSSAAIETCSSRAASGTQSCRSGRLTSTRCAVKAAWTRKGWAVQGAARGSRRCSVTQLRYAPLMVRVMEEFRVMPKLVRLPGKP